MLQNLQLVNQTLFVACILLVVGIIGLISQRRAERVLIALGVSVAGVLLLIAGMNSLNVSSSAHEIGWAVLILFVVYDTIGGSLLQSPAPASKSTQEEDTVLTLVDVERHSDPETHDELERPAAITSPATDREDQPSNDTDEDA
ncbi:MAG: hypothetical protein O3A00_22210 [Planctomycetota bacterium]|nr:hypothetical protein [Planctomycetota bacterium]